MKNTKSIVETLTDNEKKKQYLKSENKQLRDQLKSMSDNVNKLIDKMNQESLKKKMYLGPGGQVSVNGDAKSVAKSMGGQSIKSGSEAGQSRVRAAD